jgi:hypothetical protein
MAARQIFHRDQFLTAMAGGVYDHCWSKDTHRVPRQGTGAPDKNRAGALEEIRPGHVLPDIA